MNKDVMNWPFLNELKNINSLPYLDYSLAHFLLKDEMEPEESIAAFICHLSLSAKQGHLCIYVDEEYILPDPKLVWLDPDSESELRALSESEFETISVLIHQGAKKLSETLCQDNDGLTIKPIYRSGSRYYFHKNWRYETEVMKYFMDIRSQSSGFLLDLNKVEEMISEMESVKRLLPEQAQAIRSACHHNFTIICGGPGTGKTYTAGHLIRIYWNALPEQMKSKCQIALAAPTGKAAANLQKSLSMATCEIPELVNLQAKTLHSLLGIHSKSSGTNTTLNADFVLIDESSMIDAKMMRALLKAIKPGAKLIFLGDPHQLPPVESGALFGDMIDYLSETSEVCRLTTCLRSDLKVIIDFAYSINQGNYDSARSMMNLYQGVTFNRHTNFYSALEDALHLFPSTWDGISSPASLLCEYQKFRILTPLRKGLMGLEFVNRWFYTKLKKSINDKEWFAAPIMIVNNDYQIGLFNGEVGVLFTRNNKSFSGQFQKGDFAIFFNRSGKEGQYDTIPALLLPKFEYAYCLSVHKSQGSEFDHVLLLLPEGSEVFGREVLYTGVTRSRKCIEIHGSEDVFRETVVSKTERLSGLNKI